MCYNIFGDKMAKFTIEGHGNFKHVMEQLHQSIISGSFSSHLEDKESSNINGVLTETAVYERYSFTGSNRLSLTVSLIGFNDKLKLTLITSGGSRGIFFKFNRIGENSFLNKLIPIAQKLIKT